MCTHIYKQRVTTDSLQLYKPNIPVVFTSSKDFYIYHLDMGTEATAPYLV